VATGLGGALSPTAGTRSIAIVIVDLAARLAKDDGGS
jgi:hypothetical protein